MWVGYRSINSDFWLRVPDGYPYEKLDADGTPIKHIMACWFTNLDHGKRHEVLPLMTMAHNLKFNRKLKKKYEQEYGKIEYPHYDNYDAIEVPFTECIPSDYDGVMGVPITFMDKYNPDQFEIIDINPHFFMMAIAGKKKPDQLHLSNVGGKDPYARILIRNKHPTKGAVTV